MMSLFDEEEVMRSYIRSERYEAAEEATLENKKKTAIRLIKLDKMSLDDIAEATELPLDIVRKLKEEAMQLSQAIKTEYCNYTGLQDLGQL